MVAKSEDEYMSVGEMDRMLVGGKQPQSTFLRIHVSPGLIYWHTPINPCRVTAIGQLQPLPLGNQRRKQARR